MLEPQLLLQLTHLASRKWWSCELTTFTSLLMASSEGFFLENNTMLQTILLVSNVSKLFTKLTS